MNTVPPTPSLVAVLPQSSWRPTPAPTFPVEQLFSVDTQPELLLYEMKARCRTTSPLELARLAKHPNLWIRVTVAANPHTGVNTLSQLATDPSHWVRCRVAQHQQCPVDLLVEFVSGDPDVTVRRCAAKHPAFIAWAGVK